MHFQFFFANLNLKKNRALVFCTMCLILFSPAFCLRKEPDFLDDGDTDPAAAAAAAPAAAEAQPSSPVLAVAQKKPPKTMLEAYSRALEGFPLLTKTLTSGMLSSLGYCLSQLLIRQAIVSQLFNPRIQPFVLTHPLASTARKERAWFRISQGLSRDETARDVGPVP